MKIVFLTGSHPRHAYMARSFARTGHLAGLVIEHREAFVPEPPEGLRPETAALFRRHFAGRDAAEARHFGPAVLPDVTRRNVELEELNTPATVDFVNGLQPDLVFSYGVHKLTAQTLAGLRAPLKWNIHGGLSPWYRGVITHFWPSYFLEPQMTGMTVHELTQDIDGGSLVHQSAADLVPGDGIHDLACRAVSSLGEELTQLVDAVKRNPQLGTQRQTTTGRIWRGSDWRPEHLHPVYDLHDNRIVDRYLEGAFERKAPKLFRQF
ncbi:formyltransferase family protein [Ramlibacter sp.]|uniref:formyltransferase family protein n=1 Tax=Ramlibacter sp. TaxID=1917967 RepID=UPI003D0ACEDC